MSEIIKPDNWWEESRSFKKTKVEEYLNIDETLVELEKNSSVIRLEMNSIELPLFSKDPKRIKNEIKVYHFKTDKSSFLEIEAPAGSSIPGEFEERVFIALTKIMKKNGYKKNFIVTLNEIIENLNVNNSFYIAKIKKALVLLSKTNYTFKNSLYSNEAKGILDKEIISTIMSITIITRKDSDADKVDQFEDKRVKEVYLISFTEHFYNNIIAKGYLAFDSEKLLAIENSVSRSVYTMIEKWRGYELYLKRPVFFIARRIPLKWDKKNIGRTVKIIEKALNDLKNQELIKHFNIIKEKKWELAEIEVFFEESHNDIKRETFFSDINNFKGLDMIVTSTEEKSKEIIISGENSIEEILRMFPERVVQMKTFEGFIKNSVEKHGFDYVKHTAEYTIMKKPSSYKSYLLKALEGNWADEYIAQKKSKENKKNKKEEMINEAPIEEAQIVETFKYNWEDYLSLNPTLQSEIESAAYKEFLVQTKSIDNKIIRGIFEKSKNAFILNIMKNYTFETHSEIEKNIKEEPIVFEEKKKIETLQEFVQNSNEIINKYASITDFVVEVSKIAKEKNITFDLVNVVPVFKLFGEYESNDIKIVYNEETKEGTILIK